MGEDRIRTRNKNRWLTNAWGGALQRVVGCVVNAAPLVLVLGVVG